jgi:hypothetical protein
MATESQINANREKAKFSSGPKPPKAKPNPPAITPNSVSSPSTTTLAPAGDPMIYPAYLPTQNAIDRARTSAQSGMRRAKADLDKMQAARRKAQRSTVLQFEPKSAPGAEPIIPQPQKPVPATADVSKRRLIVIPSIRRPN